MTRQRYDDVNKVGRSALCEFRPDEAPQDRHLRRKRVAGEWRDTMRAELAQREIELTIHNDGHHWQMKRGADYWEWWPSTAKLVVNKKWAKGIHVHDYVQVLKVIDGGAK